MEWCQAGWGDYEVRICPWLGGFMTFIFLTWFILVHYRPLIATTHCLLCPVQRTRVFQQRRGSSPPPFQSPHHPHISSSFSSAQGPPDPNPRTPCSHIIFPQATSSGHSRVHLPFLSTQLNKPSQLHRAALFPVSHCSQQGQTNRLENPA